MFLLISLHVLGNLVWIGSIACVGWLLAGAASATSATNGEQGKASAQLSAAIYRRIAVPAFLLSFVFGVAALASNVGYYMHAHWFHGKLAFALVVIALHHVIGAKAKRAASGDVQAGSSGAILTGGLLVSAFAVVVFVIYKTALVP